jgi:hypothetical protein
MAEELSIAQDATMEQSVREPAIYKQLENVAPAQHVEKKDEKRVAELGAARPQETAVPSMPTGGTSVATG